MLAASSVSNFPWRHIHFVSQKLAWLEFSACDFASFQGMVTLSNFVSIAQFGQKGFDLRLAMTFHVHSKRDDQTTTKEFLLSKV